MNDNDKESRSYTVTTLRDSNRTIRVYGVTHIATAHEHQKVLDSLVEDVNAGFTIHYEGMKDVPDRKSPRKHYDSLALLLKLSSQRKALNDALPGKVKDISWNDLGIIDKTRLGMAASILRREVMELSNKSPDELTQYRKKVLSTLHDPAPEGKSAIVRVMLGSNLTDKRSRYAARSALEEGTDISLVWGCGHVPEIVKVLESNGLHVESTHRLKLE